MAGIETFEARRVLSIGNGGIHAVVEHKEGDVTTYLSLGTLTNFVGGKQQSYGRHYVNGSHLSVGEATLGVSMANARFVFDRIDEDIVSQLAQAAKDKKIKIFEPEENYEVSYASASGSSDIYTDKVNFEESVHLTSSTSKDSSLSNLQRPLKIILFSTVDYCNELGVLGKTGSLGIDEDLKYNVVVRQVIEDVVFSKSSVGGNGLTGFTAGVYDAICSDIIPWHFVNSVPGKTFSPLTLNSGKKLSEFLK